MMTLPRTLSLSSAKFLAILFVLWAALYLPGLGDAELKGEEGRRSLPAIAMIERDDWVVPWLNGEPYLRKPPLLNWMIAGAFQLTGEISERAARLPSVLSVLLLAGGLYLTARSWMSEWQARMVPIFFLTSLAMIEKGRLAEIEALYIALTGLGFAFWLREWMGRRRDAWLWVIPSVFLGAAMLAKGPSHLVFFYGMIVPVLWQAGELKRLRGLAHGLSLVVIGVIFAAWAIPCFQRAAESDAGGVWLNQAGNVVAGGSVEWSEWLPNFPSTLVNALPWLLLVPLLWSPRVLALLTRAAPAHAALITATRWPLAIGFLGLMVFPGVLPRYTLPLLPWFCFLCALVIPYLTEWAVRLWRGMNRAGLLVVVFALLAAPWVIRPAQFQVHSAMQAIYLVFVALVVIASAFLAWRRAPLHAGVQAVATSGIAIAVIAYYASVILPRKSLNDDLRPVAALIHQHTDENSPIFVVGRAYEPLFFYLKRPLEFEKSPRKIPDNAKQILFRPKHMKRVKARWPQASEATRLQGADKKEFFLLKLSPETEKNPGPDPRS